MRRGICGIALTLWSCLSLASDCEQQLNDVLLRLQEEITGTLTAEDHAKVRGILAPLCPRARVRTDASGNRVYATAPVAPTADRGCDDGVHLDVYGVEVAPRRRR